MPLPQNVDPTTMSPEEELKNIEKLNEGFMDLDEDQDIGEPKKPEEETPPAKPKEQEPPKEEPEVLTEKPKEETPPVKSPEGTPTDGVQKDGAKPQVERPVRFIPLAQYHDEKRGWEQDKQALATAQAEIARLSKDAGQKPDTQKEEETIKAYSEKWLMEPEQVKELLDIARKGNEIPAEVLATIQKQKEDQTYKEQVEKDTQNFRTEYTRDIEPEIKKMYPTASPEALKEAQEHMDKLAHSSEALSHTPLSYILAKHTEDFKGILTPQEPKYGAERGRQGGGHATQPVTASQFKPGKDGKYDFSALDAMEDGEAKDKVLTSLDPFATVAYTHHVDSSGEVLEVNRGGRKIKLK